MIKDGFKIGNKKIFAKKKRCFIIAEIGINHLGNLNLCKKMIIAASKSGADAVKLQSIEADESYVKGTQSYRIFKNKSFSISQLKILKNLANKKKIQFFSTPGDLTSLKKLKKIGVSAIKISSGLLSNTPLIAEAAKLNKPMIFSTGMADLTDIIKAISIAKKNGCKNYSILKCTSIYPAESKTINLNGITTLKKLFKVPIGYSDHYLGDLACIASIVNGATIIEKHFTTNNNLKGADNKISSEPKEFKIMVNKIREIEKMMGDGKIYPRGREKKEKKIRYRFIVAKKNIIKNVKISFDSVAFKRLLKVKNSFVPADYYWKIKGRKIIRNIKKNTPLNRKDYS